MNIFKNNFLIKLIAALCLFLALISFGAPTTVRAEDDDGWGGVLITPVIKLLTAIGDAIMEIMQKSVINQEASFIKIEGSDWWVKWGGKIIGLVLGAILAATIILSIVAGFGFTLTPAILTVVATASLGIGGTGGYFIVDYFDGDDFSNNIYLPIFNLSLDRIFSDQVALLGINFFNDDKVYIKFEIEVNMDNGSVSFLNLEPEHRRKSYWGDNCMHPHISKSGDACFGNVAESVMMAIKNMDIKSLCVILLNYLSSVNPADAAGAFLTNWDVVDENGIIVDFPVELTSCSHCGGRVTELNKENFHVCHDCDKNFCKDHIKQYTVYNEKSMQKDVFLCNLCRNEYFSCAECSHIVRNKYLCEVCGLFHCHDCVESATNQDGKAIHICKKCKEKMSNKKICQGKVLIKCSVCGHLHLIDIEQAPDYDSFICDNCKSNMCIFCHEEIHGQKIHISPTESLCVECWKKTDTCDVCGNRKLKEDLAYNDANNTKRCKNGCEV